jgi:hypothetical protein
MRHFRVHRAFRIVIRNVINPRTHWIATHEPSIEGFQEITSSIDIGHRWVELQIVAARVEDDRHPVMDGSR